MGAHLHTTMQNQATPSARANAKTLRCAMTESEQRLWTRLRGEQLGVKFRRQHPLGAYVADFACLAPRLIIEVDGSQHAQQQAYDAQRTAFFSAQGFVLLRFASNEVFINLDGVLQAIVSRLTALALRADPHPHLPPEGEGADHLGAST